METVIEEASQYFSVISVTGPRQSGKSTLLKHLFPQFHKYSLKDVNVREFAEKDPVSFLRQHPEGMFIDEVQKVPQLLEYIQGIVDDRPECRFLLTGSSNFELLQGLSESLPGRSGVYELLPMTFQESASTSEGKTLDTFLYDGLLEKPSAFAPRGQATLTLTGKIRMTLCGKIKLTPECDCHSGAFL